MASSNCSIKIIACDDITNLDNSATNSDDLIANEQPDDTPKKKKNFFLKIPQFLFVNKKISASKSYDRLTDKIKPNRNHSDNKSTCSNSREKKFSKSISISSFFKFNTKSKENLTNSLSLAIPASVNTDLIDSQLNKLLVIEQGNNDSIYSNVNYFIFCFVFVCARPFINNFIDAF